MFAHLGGLGVLLLSVLDSSPVLIPLGNDLLFVAMTARKAQPHDLLYADGGCGLSAWVPQRRRAGSQGWRKRLGEDRRAATSKIHQEAREEECGLGTGHCRAHAASISIYGLRRRRGRASIPAQETAGRRLCRPIGALHNLRPAGDLPRPARLATGPLPDG